MVGRKVDAEASQDLVHDILLQVLRNEESLAAADEPIAWVYTVAKHKIADYYRKRSREETEHAVRTPDDLQIGAAVMEVDKEFADCLGPLVDRLEPKYREALHLVDFKEMTQQAAADLVGLSVSGMKSRVQRGRSKLKAEILACCSLEKDRFGTIIDYTKNQPGRTGDCCSEHGGQRRNRRIRACRQKHVARHGNCRLLRRQPAIHDD